MTYWVQDAPFGTLRQAVIHLGECPLCEEGKKKNAQDQWYGPFETLDAARDISDGLTGIAMRAECRCARKAVAQDVPTLAMLNEPLFRKPEPPKEKKAKEAEGKKLAKAAAKGKGKSSHKARYAFIGVAAVVLLSVSLYVFPALSVVEASNHSASSAPFMIANDSPIPVTDLNADCTVELQPAAVRLQNTHQQLADRLGSKNNVTIPCFAASGGSVPQVNGVTVHVTVKYAVFGIHHVEQTFQFVAARTKDGFCRWVLKS